MIDESDGIGLSVHCTELEGPDPRHVIDRGVLEALGLPSALSSESQVLDVHLDVAAGDLLVVPFGMHSAQTCTAQSAVHTVAEEDAANTGIRDPDLVVALRGRDGAH